MVPQLGPEAMTSPTHYPLRLLHSLRQTREQCAEVRSAISGEAVHETEAVRAKLVVMASKLAAIEHAIGEALGTSFPPETK